MNRQSRKSLIKLAGLNVGRLASHLNVSRSAVYKVIDGYSRSSRIEKAIARTLRVPAGDLFPVAHHRKSNQPKRQFAKSA